MENGKRKVLRLQKYWLESSSEQRLDQAAGPGVISLIWQKLAEKWAPAGIKSPPTNLFDVQNYITKTSPGHTNQPQCSVENEVQVSDFLHLSEKLKHSTNDW